MNNQRPKNKALFTPLSVAPCNTLHIIVLCYVSKDVMIELHRIMKGEMLYSNTVTLYLITC